MGEDQCCFAHTAPTDYSRGGFTLWQATNHPSALCYWRIGVLLFPRLPQEHVLLTAHSSKMPPTQEFFRPKKWVSLTFQRCVDWLLMTLSSVHDKRQLVACGTTANAHRGTLLQPGNSFLTAVHTHGTAEAAPAVPSVNPS